MAAFTSALKSESQVISRILLFRFQSLANSLSRNSENSLQPFASIPMVEMSSCLRDRDSETYYISKFKVPSLLIPRFPDILRALNLFLDFNNPSRRFLTAKDFSFLSLIILPETSSISRDGIPEMYVATFFIASSSRRFLAKNKS